MRFKQYQVDAFAARPFEGNPAAVVPLEEWLPDGLMQSIALENNPAGSDARLLFRRQRQDEVEAATDPGVEIVVRGEARGRHVDEAPERLAGKVHLARVGLGEGVAVGLRTDPQHQLLPEHADAHVAVHHQGKAAKHLAFHHLRRPRRRQGQHQLGHFKIIFRSRVWP